MGGSTLDYSVARTRETAALGDKAVAAFCRHPHRAHRLAGHCSTRSGYTRCGHCTVGAEQRTYAEAHLPYGGLTHCTLGVKHFLGHSEQIFLYLVAVRHHRAHKVSRTACHLGDGVCHIAASATLGSGKCHIVLQKQASEYLRRGLVFVGYDIFAKYLVKRFFELVHSRFYLCFIITYCRQAKAYDSRFGKISQLNKFRQTALEVGKCQGKHAFGIVDYHKGAIFYVFIVHKVLHELWYHCLCHHSFGLKRHTGHRHQHFIIFLKPHERCCAHAILYHSARRGHHGLIMIEVVHCQAALVKHFFHIEQGGFVEHHLAAEIFAKRGFGDIIFSGTKAACHKHHIGLVKGFVDGLLYLFGIVAYYLYALGFPSVRTKIAGYPTRIGVGNLPDKQLITNYYYRIIHCSFLSVLVKHLFHTVTLANGGSDMSQYSLLRYLKYPAMAIIAALSVVKERLGINAFMPRRSQ